MSFVSVQRKGPAIELNLESRLHQVDRFHSDVTFSIRVPQWPTDISNWEYQTNRKWPELAHVRRIVSLGCHLVPKSHPDDEQGTTWRLSFSKAEVELSKLVPENARICFIGLKISMKDYLAIAWKGLASYHLKCILFYTLEEMGDSEIWYDETYLEICFNTLLHKLMVCVNARECLHYWIPQMNLFKHMTEKESKRLSRVLAKVQRQPEKFIEEFTLPKDKRKRI